MLRKGDLVRPVTRRYRYKGGTLAIVIATDRARRARVVANGELQIMWLNGGFRGRKIWDYPDLFEKVTERNQG
jgi:hypothetical protein